MQFDSDRYFHLTYCTNIHPGESLDEVERNLHEYSVPLKERLAPDRPFGIGLRLSNRAARELLANDRLQRFQDLLSRNDLYVFTLNGFPYGGFHRTAVKDNVYAPDWRTDERLEYTLRLFEILSVLLPDGQQGSISTSPLSYKPWHTAAQREEVLEASSVRLAIVAAALRAVREETGQLLHLGIEPEPDCLLQNSLDTVTFFKDWLLRIGADYLRNERGMTSTQAEITLLDHIRVCYDTCHFAVEFESPDVVFSRLEHAGIALSKIQISAALRVLLDQDVPYEELVAALQPFAESTYLHQVVQRDHDGKLSSYPDLPEALLHLPDADAAEWRIHYHVPIFVDRFEHLHSTQRDIVSAVERVLEKRMCPHLEIETYTWDVLPDGLKTDVVSSIEREYEWLISHTTRAASF